jgi:dUTP pyrophosphatase
MDLELKLLEQEKRIKNLEEFQPLDPLHDRLLVKRLHTDAIVPRRAHRDDAGLDLFACWKRDSSGCIRPWWIHSHSQGTIGTGIALAIPTGFEGQVRPRSGLAKQYEITLTNSPGTIDAGFTGEILLIVRNLSYVPFKITYGMKIAQLVIARVANLPIDLVDSLPTSDRGEHGFGSTGK